MAESAVVILLTLAGLSVLGFPLRSLLARAAGIDARQQAARRITGFDVRIDARMELMMSRPLRLNAVECLFVGVVALTSHGVRNARAGQVCRLRGV